MVEEKREIILTEENVIVTGGAGYIGSHACLALKRAGYNPITIDNLSTGWRAAVKFGPFEFCDLTDKDLVYQIFQKYKPIAVLHFAALSQVGESVKNPSVYWRQNTVGAMNLIESAIANDCKNIIFSSTCATYGDADNRVLDENSPQSPINAYGSSKLAIEHMLRDYDNAGFLKFIIFRYFNVAGADPDGQIGELHQPETHLVPIAIHTAMKRRDKLIIYGDTYKTEDGTCIRDYVHVVDLVNAHVAGLKFLRKHQKSEVYNLGTGRGFSVKEVINAVESVTNLKIVTEIGEKRPGDCSKLVSGSSKALSDLEWEPKNSQLEKMVRDAWNWHKLEQYY